MKKRITIMFDEDQYDRIKELAKEQDRTFGNIVRMIIKAYLDSLSH